MDPFHSGPGGPQGKFEFLEGPFPRGGHEARSQALVGGQHRFRLLGGKSEDTAVFRHLKVFRRCPDSGPQAFVDGYDKQFHRPQGRGGRQGDLVAGHVVSLPRGAVADAGEDGNHALT